MTDEWKPGEPAPCEITDPHPPHVWGVARGHYTLRCPGVKG